MFEYKQYYTCMNNITYFFKWFNHTYSYMNNMYKYFQKGVASGTKIEFNPNRYRPLYLSLS